MKSKNVIFTSAYCNKYSNHFAADIRLLTSYYADEFFIFGGAKHSSWNSTNNNTAGGKLFQIQNDSNFFIYHPFSATYVPSSGSTQSTLDILLSNSNASISDLTPLMELNSDHYPVICSIDFRSIKRFNSEVFNFSAANWHNFSSFIDNKIDLLNDFKIESASPDSIDHAINVVIKTIIDAKLSAVPKTKRSIESVKISSISKSLIAQRNLFRRRLQRCDLHSRGLFKSLMNQCNLLIY